MTTSTMADTDKVRLVVVVDEELRAALRLAAAQRDQEMAEVVSELLTTQLAEQLAEIRKRRSEGDKDKPKKPKG